VVGLGSIGKRHLCIIKEQYPEIKLLVLRHSQCEEIELEKFGLTGCVTNVEKAIEFKPDAAIIATPATKHINMALTLAKAGVHLLIEKPISAKSDGVESLIDICQSNNLVLMIGYNLRFQPSLQEFRKQILQNKVGRILSVRAEVGKFLPTWRPESDYTKSVSAQKKLGGGVLLELSHEIDYIKWIFGDYKWVKAHLSKQSDLKIDVEDSASIIFGIEIEGDSEIIGSLNIDFIRHDDTRMCTVIGNQGSLRWDGIKNEIGWFAKGSNEWESIFSQTAERDLTYKKEIENFLSAISQKENLVTTGEDGLRIIKVIEAIHQSHQSNSMVTL